MRDLCQDCWATTIAFLSAGKSNNKPETIPASPPNIITGEKTLVCGYVPETKQQSSQWKSPNSLWPTKAHQVGSNVKSMLIVFFRHLRHCPQGIHTPWSNRQWYVLLWDLEAAEGGNFVQTSRQVEVKQLVSPPWQSARSHFTRCSTFPDFQKHYIDSPPPCWPDLAPCDIFLFPNMKLRLKESRFDKTEEIHVESQGVIDTLTFENFQGCMKSWETYWDHCIHAQGDYFEGDSGN